MQYIKRTDESISGYLVRFTDANDPDLTGDYFTKNTALAVDEGDRIPIFYNHGQNPQIKGIQVGVGTAKYFDEGLFIESQIDIRDKYLTELEKKKIKNSILKLVDMGKLGWSSGSVPHLVERKSISDNLFEIVRWPVAEASLTPNPAEPDNDAYTKAISDIDNILKNKTDIKMTKEQNAKLMVSAELDENEILKNDEVETLVVPMVEEPAEETEKAKPANRKPKKKGNQIVADFKKQFVEQSAQIEDLQNKIKNINKDKMQRTDLTADVKNVTPTSILGEAIIEAVIKQNNNWSADKKTEYINLNKKSMAIDQLVDGAGLIAERVWDEIIPLLRPFSIFRQSGVPFYTLKEANLTLNIQTGGTSAEWIEAGSANGTATATKPQFAQRKLELKKIAAKTDYIDRELITRGAFDLATFIQTDLLRAIAQLEDFTFLYGTGLNSEIKGLLEWTPALNVVTAQSTPNVTKIREDLAAAYDKIVSANITPSNLVWFMHPSIYNALRIKANELGILTEFAQELQATDRLMGIPVYKSTTVKKDDIFLFDTVEIIGADGNDNRVKVDETSRIEYDQTRMLVFAHTGLTVRRPEAIATIENVTAWGA